jgi:shikimate dehydrogenase
MKKKTWSINGETKLIGVFGWPLTYTLSPGFQNAALRKLGVNAVYVPFPVKAEEFLPLFERLKKVPSFLGGNVTVPYKVQALKLGAPSAKAKKIGAVNTLYRQGSRWIGENTDADGFVRSLKDAGVTVRKRKILLLGAGGSARAIAYGVLAAKAGSLVIASRQLQRAAALARRFGCRAVRLEEKKLAELMSHADIIVNSVPGAAFARKAARALKAQATRKVVCDISYATKNNPLLKAATGQHLGLDGMEMLRAQGALSRKFWIKSLG